MIAIGDALIGWGFWGGADAGTARALDDLSLQDPEAIALQKMSGAGFYSTDDMQCIRATVNRRHGGGWTLASDGGAGLPNNRPDRPIGPAAAAG